MGIKVKEKKKGIEEGEKEEIKERMKQQGKVGVGRGGNKLF